MKKLLILAYDFPPYVSVGGLRPHAWYKYLKEFGVEPIVVTRQWGNFHGSHLDYISEGSSDQPILEESEIGTIIRAPYHQNAANRLMLKHGESKFRFLRKSITFYYEVLQFFKVVGPRASTYKTAKQYLKSNRVDVIIATGDPFVLFSYAAKLSKEFNTPWIADYRDPWSQSFSAKKRDFQRVIDYVFERYFVKTASSIVTVDLLFKIKLSQIFPEKEINIIPNGFDPMSIGDALKISQSGEQLTFSFIGTIYLWHPFESLLTGFSNFILKHPESNISIKFYGINKLEIFKKISEDKFPELKDKIFFIQQIPNDELLKILSKDNVLILFNYFQFTGTKIFDYLGIKRKILLCFEDDKEAKKLKDLYYFKNIEIEDCPQIDIINQTNSGIIVKDSAHLLTVLEELYAEFQATGQIACDSHGVEKYSRKIQVERLAELIKGVEPL